VGASADRGAGLGTAAVCLILDYAFNGLDLHRIALQVLDSNPARRLYERLGFRDEGLRAEPYIRGGVGEPVRLYALLKDAWTTVLPEAAHRLPAAG
jgi:RimJ/RimL family protein N-acetyltransferase